MNAITQRTPDTVRQKKSRAIKKEMVEAGYFKMPREMWIKHEAMEALADFGEYLGLEEEGDEAEIVNALLLTLHENPRFKEVFKKSMIARCHSDNKSTEVVGKYHVGSILDRMIKE